MTEATLIWMIVAWVFAVGLPIVFPYDPRERPHIVELVVASLLWPLTSLLLILSIMLRLSRKDRNASSHSDHTSTIHGPRH